MYARVFKNLLDSSINVSSVPPAYRWLWVTMLLIADEDRTGVVDLPVERLAARAGLSVADTQAGLNFLMSPDPESRSDAEEGRRIIPIRESGRGWELVNWDDYAKLTRAEMQREDTRERVRRHREKKANKNKVLSAVTALKQNVTKKHEVDVESEVESEVDVDSKNRRENQKKLIEEIFAYWQQKLNHPQARLDAKREKVIVARLAEGYSVERIKAAIDGIKLCPHNMGQNERATVYDDIELICRSGANVDRFADKLAQPRRFVGQERYENAMIPEDDHDAP